MTTQFKTDKTRQKQVQKVTTVGFLINVMLAAGKLIAGFIGNSSAMIADGVHSVSDFATDFTVLFMVRKSVKPSDADHDFGHGKYETLATIIIGLALFVVAFGIMSGGITKIVGLAHGKAIAKPGTIALVAAAISIIAKEILFRYTKRTGEKMRSSAVVANAWHHRSDALSSVCTFIGIGGACLLGSRWYILDPIAAIVVGLIVGKMAYDLVVPSVDEMLEHSLPDSVKNEIRQIVLDGHFFSDLHNLKTRRIGADIAIELHVRVPGDMTVSKSHAATVEVEQNLKKHFGNNTQVMIHVEPLIS